MRPVGAAWAAVTLLLILPGAAASLLLARHAPSWQAALALPLILLPSLLAIARLQQHQGRVAYGFGAGPLVRLRWLWLPQLGPGIAASLLLLLLFAFAARLLDRPAAGLPGIGQQTRRTTVANAIKELAADTRALADLSDKPLGLESVLADCIRFHISVR